MKRVFHNRVRVQEVGVNRMHCCYADVITNHTLIKSTTWWPKHFYMNLRLPHSYSDGIRLIVFPHLLRTDYIW